MVCRPGCIHLWQSSCEGKKEIFQGFVGHLRCQFTYITYIRVLVRTAGAKKEAHFLIVTKVHGLTGFLFLSAVAKKYLPYFWRW